MATSIKEVAREAGVSIGTVSNVLNRPGIVTPAVRERVQAAITKLGYVRNDPARQLRAGRSRTVALVVLDIANPFFADVARGADEVADASDAIAIICDSHQDAKREQRILDRLEEQRVLGVLITPVTDGPDSRVERLIDRGMPVVLVDRASGHPSRCSVAVDDVLGGQLVGAHLLAQGHRRIAYVGGPLRIRQVADRQAGLADALGTRAELLTVEMPSLTVAAGRAAARSLTESGPGVTAVACANDLLALGVLQELTRQGVRVPEDIAVVGYDDIEAAAAAVVPLTSVRRPREQLGRTAAQLLLEEVNDPGHQHRHVVFKPELVVRGSTAQLAAA